ncbi:NAD(P)H-hydrate epimerase [Aeromicrobium sp. 636]|uniref:Bifunctional NAD(P)H-hydrate repair enzyme n=1 Tax=Aeromicrobium senzhongii TaxID=2663859 RepID=A0A8I0EXX6_9ACTN|nr:MULTISPECIES: NAD(P)H-hydrate epimerase [Aeromicrobium]MBC9227516.1 NAD(P)H-hydrate epimerase [Aeromicrobium senzhongii]MCQ3999613.1 NAD(P)H-hydrate epimerase [Aeromicrobium sp. 636]
MLTAHTVAQIRAAEEVAADQQGWDGLMQRAAGVLAERLLALVPAEETAVVLVGPGNNGGDALFAAAHLLERGRRVNLCLLDASKVHTAGLAAATAAGARVVDRPDGHRVVVDALFGIGARPGLEGAAAHWAAWIERERPVVVAVDVPSGIGVDDGRLDGPAVRADHTVTFGTAKYGLLLGPAAALAGRVDVADIGLDLSREPALESLQLADGARFREQIVPGAADHKYSRGVLGIRAGSPQYAGAAHLCVAGAQAGPAGMVRFVGEPELSRRVVDRAPEVVAADGRVQAWVVGPGGQDSPEPLAAALADGVPVVVDATALGHLPDTFATDALLTPHAGELAAMLGSDRDDVEADPLTHARRAAERWSATVLLKGPRTLVVSADGRVRVNTSGTPWLGTAGAGDVLAGFAGSLLARGLDAFDAGSIAALVHGLAAERLGGPFVASDVARAMPRLLQQFCAGPGQDHRTGDLT